MIHSLAVLPLKNLSGDPSQQYFADGMTEELITDLSQVSALKIISRTSSDVYQGTHKPLPEIALVPDKAKSPELVSSAAFSRDAKHILITLNPAGRENGRVCGWSASRMQTRSGERSPTA